MTKFWVKTTLEVPGRIHHWC